ncbi:hypothetical protein K2173_024535 [Erythroxylum novogranatense]|uniref:Thionin-like protein 2 n=1 Tax=Erythroxylum novogranatense TaxID=1862640 RepID=A0AAV8SVC9_9ROSI|nr:hypothetical protein K2173_024535 [Erythroxylum novogranatense]
MEGERVRALMVVGVVVMGLLTGQATAESFGDCYKTCVLLCAISSSKSVASCAFKCLKDCIFNSSSLLDSFGVQKTSVHNLCTLQCAYPTCTSVTSRDNPREKEVASCVNSCGSGCSKKKTNSP